MPMPRDQRISIPVDVSTHTAIQQASREDHRSMAQWMRLTLLKELDARGLIKLVHRR
jgi:hypothetical protein